MIKINIFKLIKTYKITIDSIKIMNLIKLNFKIEIN